MTKIKLIFQNNNNTKKIKYFDIDSESEAVSISTDI